jgi:hypothetical protein
MTRGRKVSVTGSGGNFSGTVLAEGNDMLVIEVAPGMSTTLFRNFASTTPLQWQCAGLPVSVVESPEIGEFRKLLWKLEARTRKL